MEFAIKWYQRLIRFGVIISPIVLLIVRLGFGWLLVESGWGHLHDVPTMVHRFVNWHIPYPKFSVYMSGGTEMVGGSLIMLGLATRVISIPLFFNFCVAYATASRDELVHFFHQDPANFINDDAFPFLMLSLLMLALGPGGISIDGLLKHTVFRKRKQPQ